MGCCCPEDLNGGRPASGGGGGDADASFFEGSFTTTDLEVVTVPIVELAALGANATFRSVILTGVSIAPAGSEGLFSVQYSMPVAVAQRNTTESVVYSVPNGDPPLNAGYQPPASFGAAGIPAAPLEISGTTVEVSAGPGPLGFTVRWEFRGQLWTFDGATRVIA